MRELCLMPWLRFAGTVDPARGPTIPADPPPICCADAAGGEKCPENRTEKQENLEKQAVFWYNMYDLLFPCGMRPGAIRARFPRAVVTGDTPARA